MIVLGIDPGLRKTGFGIIKYNNSNYQYILSGSIATNSSDALSDRLKSIFDGLKEIIETYKPTCVSIEKVFVNANPQSTLLLGQARGVAIASCVLFSLPVFEYTALQVKKSVVGYGHADKTQIAAMIKYILKLNKTPPADPSDALAIAITHINHDKLNTMFNIKNTRHGRMMTYKKD